jgi:pimeloyl-ACP methyl ester carboxylesterase
VAITDISTVEFAALATDVYRDKPKGTRVFRWTRQNFFGDPTNGFFAAAYHAIKSKHLVIAFRGSGGDLGDWSMSGNLGNAIGIKLWDSQLNTATAYFDACRGIYSPDSIAVCGHSLGGFLAAMVALKRGVLGVTFDRPSLFYSAIRATDNRGMRLVNFRGGFDPVSAIRDGFGRWITVDLAVLGNIVAGRGRATISHSIDELYEAILTHSKSELPPERW